MKKRIIYGIVIMITLILLTGCVKKTKHFGSIIGGNSGKENSISIKVLSQLEKYTVSSGIFEGNTYGRVKVEIENESSEETTAGYYTNIALADSNKKDLVPASIVVAADNSILSQKIAGYSKVEGYIYFADYDDDYNPHISDEALNNAKYLRVSLYKSDYSSYKTSYISLK